MSLGPEVHFENRFLINSHESSRRRLRQMFNSTDVDSLRVHLPLSHDAREIEETNTNNVHASSVHAAMHANVNVPCVKFVGTVGGMWPTPQVSVMYMLCTPCLMIVLHALIELYCSLICYRYDAAERSLV